MESGSSGSIKLIAFLIIGVVIGFGVGYLTPALVVSDDYDMIQARGSIIVGTNTNWPPFEIFNTTSNQLEGFDIDLAEMVADYLNVTVQWIDMDFDNLVGACQAGTIDMIASATFITSARCAVLQPLCWYIRTNEVIVTKANSTLVIDELEDLVGYDVGVQTGTVEDEELSAITGMEATLTRYPVVETMFQALDAGTLDAIYVDEPIVGLYSTVYSVKIIFTVTAPPTAFYIRYGSDRLSAAINSAIAEGFEDGTVDALIAKWFG
ncbi:MAG: amino acid ABC transporter substrate-binding protein [Candidatus Thorarchaeota archaeon]|nr:amino acid ABC transporter substrate-binding protein [Candidatus Thorarchaeota archaeon]